MWKQYWKKYWKIAAAAVFLTVAGFFYGGARLRSGEIALSGQEEGTEIPEGLENQGDWAGNAEAAGQKNSGNPEASVNEGESGNPTDPTDPVNQNGLGGQSGQGYFVHICGEVKSPGVYELSEGSRVFEAVEAAGGFTEQAAGELLNLAEKISDGMKIVVYSMEEVQALKDAGAVTALGEISAGGSEAGKKRININAAGKEELMTISGIGESRAEDIIRFREENGRFQTIEDIMKVPGIKNAAFQKMKDSITV